MANEVKIVVTADTARANSELSGLSRSFDKVGAVAKKAALAIVGIGIAAGGLAILFGKAAAEEQAGITRLRTAYAALGLSYDAVAKDLEKVITATQRKTGISDSEQRDALANLIRMTRDQDTSLKLLNLSMDMARGTGRSLSESVNTISYALSGNIGMLTRVLPSLKEFAEQLDKGEEKLTAQEKGLRVLAEAQRIFAGQAVGYGKDVEGQYKILKAELSDIMDAIGKEMLPFVSKVFERLQIEAEYWVENWRVAFNRVIGNIEEFVNTFIEGVNEINIAVRKIEWDNIVKSIRWVAQQVDKYTTFIIKQINRLLPEKWELPIGDAYVEMFDLMADKLGKLEEINKVTLKRITEDVEEAGKNLPPLIVPDLGDFEIPGIDPAILAEWRKGTQALQQDWLDFLAETSDATKEFEASGLTVAQAIEGWAAVSGRSKIQIVSDLMEQGIAIDNIKFLWKSMELPLQEILKLNADIAREAQRLVEWEKLQAAEAEKKATMMENMKRIAAEWAKKAMDLRKEWDKWLDTTSDVAKAWDKAGLSVDQVITRWAELSNRTREQIVADLAQQGFGVEQLRTLWDLLDIPLKKIAQHYDDIAVKAKAAEEAQRRLAEAISPGIPTQGLAPLGKDIAMAFGAMIRNIQRAGGIAAERVPTLETFTDTVLAFWRQGVVFPLQEALSRFKGLLGFQQGGIVPAPIGQPRLAMVHGGETIIPPGKVAGGGINLNFYGPVYGMQDFERQVTRAVRDAKLAGGFYGVLA